MFKSRYLKRGAVVEIRVLRANEIGRVQRLTVGAREAHEPVAVPERRRDAPARCT